VDVLGSTLAANTVSVNGQTAYQKWQCFWKELRPLDTSAAQWLGISVTAPGQTQVSGNVFVAQNPENYGYDLDGNETSDGRFGYTWDGENRVVHITSLSGAPTASWYKLDLTYDYMGRRIQKVVSTYNGSSWVTSYTENFVYDGWNMVAILDGGNNLLYSFNWGLDLSGSMQGAGGVGGAISMTVYSGSNAGTYLYCCDGNGNVVAMVNAANGTSAAQYEYGPFGELIRATGPMAKLNPFMFSTKFYDWETGLYYYGHRYYNPSTGRWLSRDPIEEEGGFNLYAFLNNDPMGDFDFLGLFDIYVHHEGDSGLGGHSGITDNGGTNYDYGRYRGTYGGGGGLHAGPNILIRSTGWPPQGKQHDFTVYHFGVCPEIDRAMNQRLAEEVAKGKSQWPTDIYNKFKTPPEPLDDNHLYMGSDWSLSDNCSTFTVKMLQGTLAGILRDPKSSEQAKKEAQELLDLSIPTLSAPGPIDDECQRFAKQLPKIVIVKSTSNNAQKPNNSDSCGCSK
jgi:RHS repeat-associated protein